jgi:Domain of unknown function (DUF1992)
MLRGEPSSIPGERRGMTVMWRRPDGTIEVGPTWESHVERQIREAMEDGSFDDLPHRGSRLPIDDDSAAGTWAMAHRMLKNAGVAPPWIEADKEVRALLGERDRLLARAPGLSDAGRRRARVQLIRIVEAANRAIVRVNVEAPSDRQHRVLLDLEVELERLGSAVR